MEKFKTARLSIMALALMWLVSSCNKDEIAISEDAPVGSAAFIGEDCNCPPVNQRPLVTIGNTPAGAEFYIDSDRTLSCDTTYRLYGRIRVRNGATLTIEPGTIVKGNAPQDVVTNRDRVGFLIIEKTGAIDAAGTCDCPIVLTSGKPKNFRAKSDWGGLILAGNGLITTSSGAATANIEGFISGETPIPYGGDNSVIAPASTLQYVRVEASGIDVSGGSGNESNGITLGGIQNSVYTIDHIQVSISGDDGFEWFGGDVNGKYLYSYKTQDDDFDLDQGFSGKVQFGVAWRGPKITDSSGSNGMEADGILNSGACTLPFGATTQARFSNLTFLGNTNAPAGNNFEGAIRAREGVNLQVRNSLFGSFPRSLGLTDKPTWDNYNATGNMFRQNLFVSGNRQDIGGCQTNVGGYTEAALEALLQATKNGFVSNPGRSGAAQFLGLSPDALKGACPELVPIDYKTQVDFTGDFASYFTTVAYRGAFGPNDVNSGWCTNCEGGDPKWLEFKPHSATYE